MATTATSGDSQKELLALIRGFASEKSLCDRRVSDLKKRVQELRSELDSAAAGLDAAKRTKEAAEQDLRGAQVQSSILLASINTLEGRISVHRQELSELQSRRDALKDELRAQRDDFIKTMQEFNKKIRQFQDVKDKTFKGEQPPQVLPDNGTGKTICSRRVVVGDQDILESVEDKIKDVTSHIQKQETEYQKAMHDHDKVCEEITTIEKKWILATAIMEETKQLQELAGQTNELEKLYVSLGEELQRKVVCPSCGSNNILDLEGAEQNPMETNE